MKDDLLALLRSMDHLGVKLVMLKTQENPSSECSGSSTFENQQEDQYDDKVDEGVRAKHFMFRRNKRMLAERGDEFWKERWLLVICQPFTKEYWWQKKTKRICSFPCNINWVLGKRYILRIQRNCFQFKSWRISQKSPFSLSLFLYPFSFSVYLHMFFSRIHCSIGSYLFVEFMNYGFCYLLDVSL